MSIPDPTEEQMAAICDALAGMKLTGDLGKLYMLSPSGKLYVDYTTGDATDPDQPFRRCLQMSYTDLGIQRAEHLADRYRVPAWVVWQEWARAVLGAALLHELDEWLTLDGVRVWDPHTGPVSDGAQLAEQTHRLLRTGLGRRAALEAL